MDIAESASAEEVIQGYRRMAMKWHPDRNLQNTQEAEAQFKLVGIAYNVLRDPGLRRAYDNHRDLTPRRSGSNSTRQHTDCRSGRPSQKRPIAGQDIQTKVAVSLETLFLGGEATISVARSEPCHTCDGVGHQTGFRKCDQCDGTGISLYGRSIFCRACEGQGQVPSLKCSNCQGTGTSVYTRAYRLEIPPGVPVGTILRFDGVGELGKHGGASGNVRCTVDVKPHELFSLDGLTLKTDIKVDFVTALLGGKITTEVFGQRIQVEIPEGTNAGCLVTVDAALKYPATDDVGDVQFRVVLHMPENTDKLTAEAKEILRTIFRSVEAQ